MKAFSLAFALEYGILDWLNVGLQWVPGWVAWSDVDFDTTSMAGKKLDVNANGVSDLKLGAVAQILGSRGLIKNDQLRVSLTPGIKIPIGLVDFEKQTENLLKGEGPITAASADKHVFALGGQLNVDYLPTDWLSVNFMTEIMAHPVKGKLKNAGLNTYAGAAIAYAAGWAATDATYGAMIGGMMGQGYSAEDAAAYVGSQAIKAGAVPDIDKVGDYEVAYGYQLVMTLDPGVNFPIGPQGMSISCGLPVTFTSGPGDKIDKLGDAGKANDWYSLGFGPNVTLSLFNLPLPLEFQVQYSLPLAGKNASATNTVSAQLIAYFAIP
jgi:hypothetical protein